MPADHIEDDRAGQRPGHAGIADEPESGPVAQVGPPGHVHQVGSPGQHLGQRRDGPQGLPGAAQLGLPALAAEAQADL